MTIQSEPRHLMGKDPRQYEEEYQKTRHLNMDNKIDESFK